MQMEICLLPVMLAAMSPNRSIHGQFQSATIHSRGLHSRHSAIGAICVNGSGYTLKPTENAITTRRMLGIG